jgi:hypothetical protein
MARVKVTPEAVAIQCAFALGQGAGAKCDLDARTLEGLRKSLARVLKKVDLSTWDEDQWIAVERFKAVGRRVGRYRRPDLERVLHALQGELEITLDRDGVLTSYCSLVLSLLRRRAGER